MNFTKNDYFQEKFSRLTLSKEIIEEIEFEECQFTNCTFIDCEFKKCKFLNCTFTDCLLSAINLSWSTINEIKFNQCKVIGIDWTKTQQVRDLQFIKSEINYSNFSMLRIPDTKIIDCVAKEVDFSETDLQGSDFQNTDLEKSIFNKTNLTKTDFRRATNYFIDVKNNIITKAQFSLPEALSLLQGLNILIENN